MDLEAGKIESIIDPHKGRKLDLLVARGPEEALTQDLSAIPQVRHVLTDYANGILSVWIAVDDPRPEVRYRVYDKELELLSAFPEVEFDFNLIPSLGRSAAEIASRAKVAFSRQE
jgi:hypothetical protein